MVYKWHLRFVIPPYSSCQAGLDAAKAISSSNVSPSDNEEVEKKEEPVDEGAELRLGLTIYQAAKSGNLDLVKRWAKHNPDLKT